MEWCFFLLIFQKDSKFAYQKSYKSIYESNQFKWKRHHSEHIPVRVPLNVW